MTRLTPPAGPGPPHTAARPPRRADPSGEAPSTGAGLVLRRVGAGLVLALITSAASCAHAPQPLPALTTRRWHEDLATFGRELPRRHKSAFHHVSRDSFEHALADLDRRLPGLSGDEVYFGLRHITSLIGDGHTGLLVPTNFHRYPLVLRPFGDDLRVVRAGGEALPLASQTPLRSAAADTALWLRRRPQPLWWAPLGDSCLFVSFRGYTRLARYARPMWREIDRRGIRTLIVDLRLNGGGNFITGRHQMVDPARRRLAAGTLRQVIALIGNSTFSAAMVNAIDFRTRCGAVLVGEPIGERPNSFSERRVTRLPHSRIGVTYSVRWYAFRSDRASPTVMPDARVEPTWDDWRAGRDPVLEWAVAHRAR